MNNIVSFCDLKDDVVKMGDPEKINKDCESYSLAISQMKYIIADVSNIKHYYLVLGKHLVQLQNSESWFSALGFDTFEDAVRANTGLDKSAISRCMNVYFEFARVEDGKRIPDVKEEYKDYSYSQLCELLPLDADKRNLVMPDMSVKEIREFKRSLKEKVAMSQLDEKSQALMKSDPVMCKSRGDLMRGIQLLVAGRIEELFSNVVVNNQTDTPNSFFVDVFVGFEDSDLQGGKYRLVLQKVKE